MSLLGSFNGVQVASGGCCFTSDTFTTIRSQTSKHEDQLSTPHDLAELLRGTAGGLISGQVKAPETASILSFWSDFNPRHGSFETINTF